MTIRMRVTVLLVTLATLTANGCAGTASIDHEFGKSVRQMTQAQTFDPAAAANPPALGPQMQDGESAVIRLEQGVRSGASVTDSKATIKRRVWKFDTVK